MKNLLDIGFKGEIFPINKSGYSEIFGFKAYRYITEVKETVDLAVIAVPAAICPHVVRNCGVAGVKVAIVISSGFREVGNITLESLLKRKGIRDADTRPQLSWNILSNLKGRYDL